MRRNPVGGWGGNYSLSSLTYFPLLSQDKHPGRRHRDLQGVGCKKEGKTREPERGVGLFSYLPVNCLNKSGMDGHGVLRSCDVYSQVMGPAAVQKSLNSPHIAADPLGAGAKGPPAVLAASEAGGARAGRTLVAPEPGAPLPPRP